MLDQKEIILVGLGEFGKCVSNNLVHMIEERRIQLGKIANSVVLHTVNFENTEVFKATDYFDTILDTVKDSSAKKMGEKFSFIFIGDLFESGTSQYAVDFAYLPYLMEQQAVLNHGEVLGFFTFASEIGFAQKVSDESIALICKHFKHLQSINEKDVYSAPYKSVQNHSFKDITLPKGPFDRNYVLVTPGKSDVVAKETGIVFAERIFYELFYLAPKFTELSPQWSAALNEKRNSDKNLSCFSMVQIPRINEIQKYYLKYILEDKIISAFLVEPLKGTDEKYYLEKFFNMIEVPANTDEFPIDRAIKLFTNIHKEKFTHILNYYVSGKNVDFKNYIEDCKSRIDEIVSELRPRYDEFSSREINYLFVTMKAGFENLFKLNRLTGNIKTYINFVEKLQAKLENWSSSLARYASSNEVIDLEEAYNKAEAKIKKLQKKKIYSFLPLIPIRKKLIENAILSVPVEEYLESQIRQRLAESLLAYWDNTLAVENHPITECKKLVNNLKNLEERFTDKEQYLSSKIQFIENMNHSYYIIPMYDEPDDYSKLLQRIRERNFGLQNKKKIDDTVTNAFKMWTSEKDIFGITQNPTEFINFIENKFIEESKSLYTNIEENVDNFFNFSKKAVKETIHKTETLNEFSFQTVGSSLFQNQLMLVPKMETRDSLHDEIEASFDSLDSMTIPKDFTLGSVIYFQDYLYMSQESMKKKDFLDNFKNKDTPKPEYDNELTEKIVIPEMHEETDNTESDDTGNTSTDLWKYTRSLLMFYMDNTVTVDVYNKTFNDSKDFVTDQEIENLSMTISLPETLKYLSDEKLKEFAKDNDIPVRSDREKQEKLIVHEISQR